MLTFLGRVELDIGNLAPARLIRNMVSKERIVCAHPGCTHASSIDAMTDHAAACTLSLGNRIEAAAAEPFPHIRAARLTKGDQGWYD